MTAISPFILFLFSPESSKFTIYYFDYKIEIIQINTNLLFKNVVFNFLLFN